MNILVSSPEVDNITRYLRIWSRKLVDEFKNKHQIYHIEKEQVTRKRFCGMLEKLSPEIVLANGHGNYDRVCGHNGEILLNATNAKLLNGKVAHALSCRSARDLGTIAVNKGAKAYIGYEENWILCMRGGMLSNPLQDKTAELFLRPAFKVQEALLDGKSPSEAVEQGKKEYLESLKSAFHSDVQSDWEQCAPYLVSNMMHLKVIERDDR